MARKILLALLIMAFSAFCHADKIVIEAEDSKLCRITGESQAYEYPRCVGIKIVSVSNGTLSFETPPDCTAVYARLPYIFKSPGPKYFYRPNYSFKYSIDGKASGTVSSTDSPLVVPLAENLQPGKHSVLLEPVKEQFSVDSFILSDTALSCVYGVIATNDYEELLTDVRADIYSEGRLLRSEYVRNPASGKFELFDLSPGVYDVVFEASGWKPFRAAGIKMGAAGEKVNAGTFILEREITGEKEEDLTPCFGRTVNAVPGSDFSAAVYIEKDTIKKARLVSRFNSRELAVKDVKKAGLGGFNFNGSAAFSVPEGTPPGMYALELDGMLSPQAVCIREPLNGDFTVALCGHMNTWGQRTSEYLKIAGETAELAGCRMLLVANEVNAAYVSGALKDLQIPYLAVRGNHTMARWDEFFGPRPHAYDDGPLRVVTFGDFPDRPWNDVAYFLGERKDATCRIVLGFEPFMPAKLAAENRVNAVLSGHFEGVSLFFEDYPKETLVLGQPGQNALMIIPFNKDGAVPLYVKNPKRIPVIPLNREKMSSPLRAEYSSGNNGTSDRMAVTVVNDSQYDFPEARLRLVLKPGKYRLSSGRLLSEFDSDDKLSHILEVAVEVKKGEKKVLDVSPENR